MLRKFLIAASVFIIISNYTYGQTLGGNSVYSFLKLPVNPQTTALGGINLTNQSEDISLAFHNPSLLMDVHHTHMAVNFNAMYDGIKTYHWMLGYHQPKIKTNFAIGIFYIDYGSIVQTDAAGNTFGELRPKDFVIQLSASKKYQKKWNYGMTAKFIHSDYGAYRSSGLAFDVGVLYTDTSNQIQASVVAKNMGTQITKYSGAETEDLPFDLQIGISKRLANAPIQFSATLHHLHHFDIFYNDTTFNNDNGAIQKGSRTFEKIFQHFVLAAQFYIGDRIELTGGYNYLRRTELNVVNAANGLNGFSFGIGALLPKLQIRYARAYYQNNKAYNQLGINMPLNKYFGLGKFGERVGW